MMVFAAHNSDNGDGWEREGIQAMAKVLEEMAAIARSDDAQ